MNSNDSVRTFRRNILHDAVTIVVVQSWSIYALGSKCVDEYKAYIASLLDWGIGGIKVDEELEIVLVRALD